MSTTFHHDHERAVVHFGGDLDWASAMEFVDIVDGLVSHYFYRRIKVVVTSPGGATAALDHVVRALERWRNAGVAIHTRVVAEAASAAAVLVSLGDDRAAEPGARLMYHYSRVIDAREVTAHASTHIHSALTRVDRQMVERIVTRALRTAGADAPPHHADPTDRFVAERLADAAAAKGRMRKARSVRALARAVGRAVDAAVERGDRARLTRLYRALFATGLSISAELARTLRLIDRIGVPDACALRPAERPGLTVPEWRALYPPHGTVPRKLLTRHVAILGETGSGKTVSAILPVVGALARARRGSTACALVIDPKHEIVPMLERLAPRRLQHLTAGRLTLKSDVRSALGARRRPRGPAVGERRRQGSPPRGVVRPRLAVACTGRADGCALERPFFRQPGRPSRARRARFPADAPPSRRRRLRDLAQARRRRPRVDRRAPCPCPRRRHRARHQFARAVRLGARRATRRNARQRHWHRHAVASLALRAHRVARPVRMGPYRGRRARPAGAHHRILERKRDRREATCGHCRHRARGVQRVRGARDRPDSLFRLGARRRCRHHRLRAARLARRRRAPSCVPARSRRTRSAHRGCTQGAVLRGRARRPRPRPWRRRRAARGLCVRRIPQVRHQRRRPRGTEFSRHMPVVRHRLRARNAEPVQHRARFEPRRGHACHPRGKSENPLEQHRREARIPLDRRLHRRLRRRALPQPPGLDRRYPRPPPLHARSGRVLCRAARRAVRAPPAPALRR